MLYDRLAYWGLVAAFKLVEVILELKLKGSHFIVGFLFSSLSCFSFAEHRWHQSTIKRIYPLSNGNFVLVFNKDSTFCPSANSGKYHYVVSGENNMSKEGVDKIYALALTAASQGKDFSINFDDSTNYCYVNRAYTVF